ncbi:MAG: type II toxin-antitoxin system VapC family toxin [Methylocystis sp.]|nr:type II toxin-antitoxin system VapC family toxin [Methylocystis sp.]MCA3589407.1 type II toxin-antitoxin system VapC family toxin [Methylocystis sp.]MCA3592644.1 type II toxin-antitoxin system VapC family toxin [Methylocystis sp.]
MAMIIDASVAGAWVMPDERSAIATEIGRRVLAEGACVPDLFAHELRNLLVMGVQRRRLPEDLFWDQLARIEQMPIRVVPSGPSKRIAQLAFKHRLTAYDAAYLDLALDQALPLASLDKDLRRAALAEGVALLPPAMPE